MVLTLVLVMFILVVAHDYYLQRRQARRMEVKSAAPEAREEGAGLSDERRGRVQGARPPCLPPWAHLGDERIAPIGARRPG